MQYRSLTPETEIIGRSLNILFNKEYSYTNPSVKEIMQKHGLSDIKDEEWYIEQKCLDVFEEIENYHGNEALELIGYLTLSDIHSMSVTDLEADFIYFDTGYQLTHRHGTLGYYELVDFDEKEKRATMDTVSPYPPHLNKGFFMAILRKHIPLEKKCEITFGELLLNERKGYRFFISWE